MQGSKRKNEAGGKERTVAAGQDSGDLDALVSGFMEELADIYPVEEDVRESEPVEKKSVKSTPKPEPNPSWSSEWDSLELTTDLEGIDKEIEESLDELERLKSGIVSITEQKGPAPESVPSAHTKEEARVVETAPPAGPVSTDAAVPANAPAHAATGRVEPAKPLEIPEEEEQAWHRPQLYGGEIDSRRTFPWVKAILGSAILVIIAGTAAFQIFKWTAFQRPPAAERASSASGSILQPADPQSATPGNQNRAESIAEAPPVSPRVPPKRAITETVVLQTDISETVDIVREASISDPQEPADNTPPRAASGDRILVSQTSDEAPPQLVASTPPKLEPLLPRTQSLLTAPTQSSAFIPPVPISQPGPSYPELALRSRTSAAVILDLQVDEQGKVTRATPVGGPVLFHPAAVAAALKWRYKPASVDGRNVPSLVRVTINFSLNN